jgi:hypothetical protein
MSETALEWSPGSAMARPIDYLAISEIEMNAGEEAGRLLGQILVGRDTVTDAQHTVPLYRAAASWPSAGRPRRRGAGGRSRLGWSRTRVTGA